MKILLLRKMRESSFSRGEPQSIRVSKKVKQLFLCQKVIDKILTNLFLENRMR